MLTVGAEWTTYDDDKNFKSESRHMLQALDGSRIYVHSEGQGSSDRGIAVHTRFQTANSSYQWMNAIEAMGFVNPTKWGYTVDVWQVDLP